VETADSTVRPCAVGTPLDAWRRHRVDYRLPAVAALVMALVLFSLMPRLWNVFGRSPLDVSPIGAVFSPLRFAEDEGLRILDVRVLSPSASLDHGAAGQAFDSGMALSREGKRPAPESGRPESGRNGLVWNPARNHQIARELLAPVPESAPGVTELARPRLLQFLSMDAVASVSLADTSQVTLGHLGFVGLQRQIFLENAPRWAYEAAAERYRRALEQIAKDNPLWGPR